MADAAHQPPPAAPPSLPDYTHYCDPTNDGVRGQPLDGPCLHGLAWWIWLLIIFGCTVCVCCIVVTCFIQIRRGNSPSAMLRFCEAVLLANHDSFHAVVSVALSPSGGLIAATGDDEELEVFAPRGGEAVLPRYAPAETSQQGFTGRDEAGIEMAGGRAHEAEVEAEAKPALGRMASSETKL